MIFVTVGTHEQPFDRLVRYMDHRKERGKIGEDVVMQIGFGTYEPKYCTWERLISYEKMHSYTADARIVITHGGPASFLMPLQMGKVPIVVPRQARFHEHVNDHQVEFVQKVAERMGTVIPVIDIDDLGQVIEHYEDITRRMSGEMNSNNREFNRELGEMVRQLLGGERR